MKIVPSVFWIVFLLFSLEHRGQCQTSKIVDFARDIAPLLKDKCLSCHQGENAKNGFDISDRDALMGYVEPGNAAASPLWTDYLIQTSKDEIPDSLVMPPDGPLNASQLTLLKVWMDEGADWPVGLSISARGRDANDPVEQKANGIVSIGSKAFRAIGYFHPAMVHFPIALYFVAGACAFFSYFLGPRCQSMAFQCMTIAAVTGILTAFMGWSFAEVQGYPEWNKPLPANATHDQLNLFFHRWLGTLTAVLGAVCVLVALMARRRRSDKLNHAWRIGAMALAALVGLVGHQGGELVYGDIFDKAIQQFLK